MKDEPLSDLLRQASIKTDNQLMAFSDSSWIYCPGNVRVQQNTLSVYQGGIIDCGTHVPGPVAQSSAESEYNTACNTGKALEHFRVLINEFLNKDPDIVPE